MNTIKQQQKKVIKLVNSIIITNEDIDNALVNINNKEDLLINISNNITQEMLDINVLDENDANAFYSNFYSIRKDLIYSLLV